MGFQNYAKIAVFKSASHGCFQPFAGLQERKTIVHEENKLSM